MRITLLTDFGTADGYAAAMKGAIARIAPSAFVEDASHEIPAGDVVAAAFALRRYWRGYPEGTVHVVVVDPGVGSERRAIAVEADGRFLVGPDNGVFSFALEDAQHFQAFELAAPAGASATFHGRDVFAPAAARIVNGERPAAPISGLMRITLPPVVATEATVRGEIVHIDRFGNLISNIPGNMLRARASCGDREIAVARTYAAVEPGAPLVLVNSDGWVEVAVRDGNAARTLQLERGAPLILE